MCHRRRQPLRRLRPDLTDSSGIGCAYRHPGGHPRRHLPCTSLASATCDVGAVSTRLRIPSLARILRTEHSIGESKQQRVAHHLHRERRRNSGHTGNVPGDGTVERLRDGVEHRPVRISGDGSVHLVVHARHNLRRHQSLKPVEQRGHIGSHIEALDQCRVGLARVGHVLTLAPVLLWRIGEIPYLSPPKRLIIGLLRFVHRRLRYRT